LFFFIFFNENGTTGYKNSVIYPTVAIKGTLPFRLFVIFIKHSILT